MRTIHSSIKKNVQHRYTLHTLLRRQEFSIPLNKQLHFNTVQNSEPCCFEITFESIIDVFRTA